MILTTPDIDVSSQTATTAVYLVTGLIPAHFVLWCFTSGESDSVPRECSGTVRRSPLVDHTDRCSRRHPDFGSVSVSAVEGETLHVRVISVFKVRES